MVDAFKKMFIYFSELIDKEVFDQSGELSGQIYDIIMRPTEIYPQSEFLVIRRGFPNHQYAAVKWSDIAQIDPETGEATLKISKAKIAFEERHDNKEEFSLRRDILDQQVVDTYNHKVIRVNDIHLLFVDHCIMAAHVDISTRGLIRRLGFERITDFLVGLVNKNSSYLKKEYLVSWKYIQPLSINPASMTIKINMPQKNFNAIPAADLGDIFQDLNINQQISLFKSIDLSVKAKIFTNIDFKTQKLLIEELGNKEIRDILNNIPPDDATDFLEKLPRNKTNQLLELMETRYSTRLSQLLGYSSDSAGGLMTTEFMSFPKDTPIETVLGSIKERTFKTEPAQLVYIVDENNHLAGSTSFRKLILATPKEPIQKAAFPKTYFVHLDSSVKEVAYLMEKYKYYAIPVVDEHNVLHGIVTVDDVLGQVISIAWRRLKRIKVQPKQNQNTAANEKQV